MKFKDKLKKTFCLWFGHKLKETGQFNPWGNDEVCIRCSEHFVGSELL